MKKILDCIADAIKPAFTASGYDDSFAKITLSNRPDLCEYQCNGAMAAAKTYKKKPIAIATDVADYVSHGQNKDMLSEITAVMPGFINIRLNPEYVAKYLNSMEQEPKYGLEESGKGETVIVDYGGANVAKPLHVGHLRSAIIGESIKRMGRFLGYDMIGDVHLGDWGLQMGLIIEELRDRKPDLPYFDEDHRGAYPAEPPFTIGELEDIYPAASAKSKEDEGFKARAQEATFRLQNGYGPFRAIWRHIMDVSLADLRKNYGNLGVTFDLWKGESDAQEYIPGLIEDLQKKGLAYESQGALVVDIAQEGDSKELPPCIIRKSDGAALYATSDLGTILDREKAYEPSRYIYITDKRQELHFIQVFRVAKKAGYVKEDTPMVHLMFGTMNGKDGKPFKTREGGVMRLEELMAQINDAVYERIMENRTVSDEEARKTAGIIGLAALKYGDLSNQASKDYIFDMDRFISFEGNTGPYILYTIVRIKSILAKHGETAGELGPDVKILGAASETEKNLMLQSTKYHEVIPAGFKETAPHKICQFIYELSDVFNKFYNSTMILKEENKERQASYIKLIRLTKGVLETCIDLLGFEAPDRM